MSANQEAALEVLREQASPEQKDLLPYVPIEESEIADYMRDNRAQAVEETIAEEQLSPEEAAAVRQAEWESANAEAHLEADAEPAPEAAPEPQLPEVPADTAYQLGQQASEVAGQRAQVEAQWQVLDTQYRDLVARRQALEMSGAKQQNPGAYVAALSDLTNAESAIKQQADRLRSAYAGIQKKVGELGAAYSELAMLHEHKQAAQALKAQGIAFDSATKAVLAEVARELGYRPETVATARDVLVLVKLAQAEGRLPGGKVQAEAPVPEVSPVDPVAAEMARRNLTPGSIEAVALTLQHRDRQSRAPAPSRTGERSAYLAAAKRLGYAR